MPELGPFGSVRGVLGNGSPYRDPRPLGDRHNLGAPPLRPFFAASNSKARMAHCA